LAADWDWEDLELFFEELLVVVGWACACGGGAEAGGDAEGVVVVAGLVTGITLATPAAMVAAREELGGEAGGADLLGAGGVEVEPWAGVVAVLVWTGQNSVGGWLLG